MFTTPKLHCLLKCRLFSTSLMAPKLENILIQPTIKIVPVNRSAYKITAGRFENILRLLKKTEKFEDWYSDDTQLRFVRYTGKQAIYISDLAIYYEGNSITVVKSNIRGNDISWKVQSGLGNVKIFENETVLAIIEVTKEGMDLQFKELLCTQRLQRLIVLMTAFKILRQTSRNPSTEQVLKAVVDFRKALVEILPKLVQFVFEILSNGKFIINIGSTNPTKKHDGMKASKDDAKVVVKNIRQSGTKNEYGDDLPPSDQQVETKSREYSNLEMEERSRNGNSGGLERNKLGDDLITDKEAEERNPWKR